MYDTSVTTSGDGPARFWHVTPLHYLPHLLTTGALYAKTRLEAQNLPVRPRPTSEARARKLGLAGFVHLSLAAQTPLLADKCAKGYPHALLEFDARVCDLPGASFLPYNTKAWRHRDDFRPITGVEEKRAFLESWRAGRYPSAELLIAKMLPITPDNLRAVHLASDAEAIPLRALLAGFPEPFAAFPMTLTVTPALFPPSMVAPDLAPLWEYVTTCVLARAVLPPPNLPFD